MKLIKNLHSILAFFSSLKNNIKLFNIDNTNNSLKRQFII